MDTLDHANITEVNGTQYFGCGQQGGTSSIRPFKMSDYYLCGVYQGLNRIIPSDQFLGYGNVTEVNGTEIFGCGGSSETSTIRNYTLQDYYLCGVSQGVSWSETKTSSGHKQSVSNAAMLVEFVLLAQCFYAVGFLWG